MPFATSNARSRNRSSSGLPRSLGLTGVTPPCVPCSGVTAGAAGLSAAGCSGEAAVGDGPVGAGGEAGVSAAGRGVPGFAGPAGVTAGELPSGAARHPESATRRTRSSPAPAVSEPSLERMARLLELRKSARDRRPRSERDRAHPVEADHRGPAPGDPARGFRPLGRARPSAAVTARQSPSENAATTSVCPTAAAGEMARVKASRSAR